MKGSKKNIPNDLKDFLDSRVGLYNNASFIENDPISIPHLFSSDENIAISGFLTAVISWGQRKQIIRSARQLMTLMDDDPYAFIQNSGKKDMLRFKQFYYRTFNNIDCMRFIDCLKNIYTAGNTLQQLFESQYHESGNIKSAISGFRDQFFADVNPQRSGKHISDPAKGSSAKRINMFLRWMVRQDDKGVDFGLWRAIPMSELCIPLDTHSGKVARMLGLLKRNVNDWTAVEELTAILRQFDPTDPVKYDFALFGLGINEKF
jgi:uncharacterized protein (TIGR02757 family)